MRKKCKSIKKRKREKQTWPKERVTSMSDGVHSTFTENKYDKYIFVLNIFDKYKSLMGYTPPSLKKEGYLFKNN